MTTHSLGYSDMVTGYNKENCLEWPHVFFFSHFWLSSRLRLSVSDCFTTSSHLIVRECVCCKMSQPSKRQRFLQSSEIAELFPDTDSGDTSDASSVECGAEGVSGVSHTQPYCQTANSPESSSSTSSSASDEDEAIESVPCEQTQQAVTLQ